MENINTKSLYNISNDLLDILNQIEENEGILDETLSNKLEITTNNLQEKVKSYVSIIKSLDDDIKLCKEEKKRLDNFRKSKELKLERLNKNLLEAVIQFGNTYKDNKYIDFGTGKVQTRYSNSVNVNEDLINAIGKIVLDYLEEIIFDNDIKESLDIDSCLSYINIQLKKYIYGDITINRNDLENILINITFTLNLSQLFDSNNFSILTDYYIFNDLDLKETKYTLETSKAELKKLLENDYDINIASLEKNINLNIK